MAGSAQSEKGKKLPEPSKEPPEQLKAEPNGIPEPIQRMMEAFQVINENVKNLSEQVNLHGEVIKQMAEQIVQMQQQPPPQQPQSGVPQHNGSPSDNDMMANLLDVGKFMMQRNQPNPWMDMFQDWMKGIVTNQTNMMQSSANLNNAIAEQIQSAFTQRVVKNVGEKLGKVVMSE